MSYTERFWMIVDVSEAMPHYQGQRVPIGKRPGFMHYDKDMAEKELLRLQQNNSAGQFVLMEAIAEARPITVYQVRAISDGIPF